MLRASTVRGRLPRMTSALLVALLSLGVPGPGLDVFASEPAAPEPGTAALSVASDPVGAAVYVNGQLQGQTPLTLNSVAPGEHRVRLVKNGFVENSRVVSVKPGQAGAVQVTMTPASGETRYTVQQDTTSGGGGGGSKKLLIGLGAVAVGAGAFLLLRDTNKAPVAGTVTASPANGIAGATSISFSSSASDPDGDPLTFAWNFGDGASGSGATATHTYAQAGTFSVTVTVSDAKKSATGSTNVTIRSLSGTWRGNIAGFPPPTVANLTQNGTALSGTMSFPGFNLRDGAVGGRVSSPFGVTFSVSVPGFVPFTFSGTSDEGATRLTGTASGSGFNGNTWTFSRQ